MPRGAVSIIGGQWRGRKIAVTELAIKPTPNRVRETLFNWLMPMIKGAYCLDLFAGSGALGFEALSRGAEWVSFVDQSFPIVKMLKKHAAHFRVAEKTHIYHSSFDKLSYAELKNILQDKAFDIIFLDPPFRKNLLEASLHWLANKAIVSPTAWVYMEHEKGLVLPTTWTTQWDLWRQKRAGQVYYELWKKNQ